MINKFNKQNLPVLRAAMNVALKDVGTRFGVDINLGNASYWEHEVKFRMVVSTLTETGEKQQDEDNFVLHAPHSGFEAEDFGKDFTSRGRQFKIVGWNNRRYKYPLKAKEVFSGKIVCFQTHVVLKLLGRPSLEKIRNKLGIEAPSFT